MFMPTGGEKEGKVEQQSGLVPERLTADSLETHWSEIAGLEFNALDTSEGRSYGEREEEIKNLYRDYLKSGKHGELFILKKYDKIVAFVAVEKSVGAKQATFQEFRLAGSHSQGRIIQEILESARSYLEDHGYHPAIIEEEGLRGDLQKMAQGRFSRFLKIQGQKDSSSHSPATNDNDAPLEKAA